MINFTIIANAELAKLMQESVKFNAFDPKKQKDHVSKIAKLSHEKQAELVKFFKAEHAKEFKQYIENLKKACAELEEMEKKLKKEMVLDKEKKSNQDDEAKMNSMLNNI